MTPVSSSKLLAAFMYGQKSISEAARMLVYYLFIRKVRVYTGSSLARDWGFLGSEKRTEKDKENL